jgi:predicted dienelactone hydrolase
MNRPSLPVASFPASATARVATKTDRSPSMRAAERVARPPGRARILQPLSDVLRAVALGALLLIGAASVAKPVHAAETAVNIAGLQVTVWANPARAGARQPVIVFSHGFHGCSTQSRFIMEAFADAGYIVFAPNHADATCNGISQWSDPPELTFSDPEAWTDATYRDRHDDMVKLLGALPTDPRYAAHIDLTRLGLCGHSLGGYTVMGLGGAWASWKIPGVKAVLALSPYSQPFIVHQTLTGMTVPVMYQGGTRDPGTTPSVEKAGGAYDQSLPPKIFVEFSGATHFAWTNIGVIAHASITTYGVAFMDHYVVGAPANPVLTRSLPDVAEMKFQL